MPPRYAYWTILIDNKPTAFRAREQDELLPTLAQLKRTNQDVVLRWFARGRLWDSPEQAHWAAKNVVPRENRNRDWRPGGQHKDPRARFKKGAKKPHGAPRGDRPWSSKPPGGPPRGDRPWSSKPPGAPPRGDRPWQNKPKGAPPRGDRPWQNKPKGAPPPGARPWHGKPRDDRRGPKPGAGRPPRPASRPPDTRPRSTSTDAASDKPDRKKPE